MGQPTLNIPIEQLEAAKAEFLALQGRAEAIRTTVDTSVRGIGSSWYGAARDAYNAEINLWIDDYQTNVNAPMNNLLLWFDNMIEIMRGVEVANT